MNKDPLLIGMMEKLTKIYHVNKELLSLNPPNRSSLVKEQNRLARLLDLPPPRQLGEPLISKEQASPYKMSKDMAAALKNVYLAGVEQLKYNPPDKERIMKQQDRIMRLLSRAEEAQNNN